MVSAPCPPMTDELRPIVGERLVAEHVIGMTVRVDHIAYRQRRDATNRQTQSAADGVGTPGVDHRDALLTDDKPEVGDVSGVERRHFLVCAVVDIHARGRIFYCKVANLRRRCPNTKGTPDDRAGEQQRTVTRTGGQARHLRCEAVIAPAPVIR